MNPAQDPGPVPPEAPTRPQRILACVLCQQRKIKCNRRFPCTNCIKARAHCVPATLAPRQSRRRFPERELLDRIRHYESILRHHHIEFEPLHSSVHKASPSDEARDDSSLNGAPSPITDKQAGPNANVKTETMDFWHAMNQGSPGSDDDSYSHDGETETMYASASQEVVRHDVVKQAWDQLYKDNDYLLFGTREADAELHTLHPGQAQIFRLWQIYLDNINPLLKVTHTPSLQANIIDAASNVVEVPPVMGALMFSIYCISLTSITEKDCFDLFGSSKDDLLEKYRFGCQQSLLKCHFLRSTERDCLTALLLYLISIRPKTDPRSLDSILGAAIRIAQRMGIHDESVNKQCTTLEAEMRRRLWWSLILFDNRICEMSDYKITVLDPTWDCKLPLNANDFDMRAEMKIQPSSHGSVTEALFTVIRGELGEFMRHSSFHLNFSNPSMKSISHRSSNNKLSEAEELIELANALETKYFRFCNQENPLHLMTIWWTRGQIAKFQLLEYYSSCSTNVAEMADAQRRSGLTHALRMLECDTQLMGSPLIKGYFWFLYLHVPFPAYIQTIQDLRRNPADTNADRAWEIISENYQKRFMCIEQEDISRLGNPLFKAFSKVVLQAWAAREAELRRTGTPSQTPSIVIDLKQKVMQMASTPQATDFNQLNEVGSLNNIGMPPVSPPDFSGDMRYDFGQQDIAMNSQGNQLNAHNLPFMEGFDMQGIDWGSVQWTLMQPNW